ncbi:response regulator transcription factor [Sabulicella glaciei]|uniref:Response regulator n=1 Tax=Sabulicella glaciei TaxID=2984948 RepID=A0ABT3P241_9PROT|nr:response regulator [Roseococcus sp. MDT2-1-1]MCW8088484.1 response regulator [Roseococcus sp. MDT2-1-1]
MRNESRTAYVVDDEAAVRRSVSLLLRTEGFATSVFESGDAFLDAASKGLPFGCVVLDLRMPGRDGMAVQREIVHRRLPHPVVIITAHGDVPLAVQAVKSGAFDFLEKPFSGEAIVRAVSAALESASEAHAASAEAMNAAARVATLTGREMEVLEGMVAGRQNKMIARDLGISPRTVETYRGNVMTKLGVYSMPEVVRLALAAGVGSGNTRGTPVAVAMATTRPGAGRL